MENNDKVESILKLFHELQWGLNDLTIEELFNNDFDEVREAINRFNLSEATRKLFAALEIYLDTLRKGKLETKKREVLISLTCQERNYEQ